MNKKVTLAYSYENKKGESHFVQIEITDDSLVSTENGLDDYSIRSGFAYLLQADMETFRLVSFNY